MTTVAAAASVTGLISISVLGVKSLISLVESVKKVVQAPEVQRKYVRELHSLERILQQLQHLGSLTAIITNAQAKQIEALALDTQDFISEIQYWATEFRDERKWVAGFRETRLLVCKKALSSRCKRLSLQIEALTMDMTLQQTSMIKDNQSTLELLLSSTRARDESLHILDSKVDLVLSSLDTLQDNVSSCTTAKEKLIPIFHSHTDRMLTGMNAIHVQVASQTHLSAHLPSIFSESQYISNASQTEPLSLDQINGLKALSQRDTILLANTEQQSAHPLIRAMNNNIRAKDQQQQHIESLEKRRLRVLDEYEEAVLHVLLEPKWTLPLQTIHDILGQEFAKAHKELNRLEANVSSLRSDCIKNGLIPDASEDRNNDGVAERPKLWLLPILEMRDQLEETLPLRSVTDYRDDNVMMKDLICNFGDTYDRIDHWLLYSTLTSPLNKILHQQCVTDAIGSERHSDQLEEPSAELAAWADCLLMTWSREPSLSQPLSTPSNTISSYSSAAAVWSAQSEFLCSKSI